MVQGNVPVISPIYNSANAKANNDPSLLGGGGGAPAWSPSDIANTYAYYAQNYNLANGDTEVSQWNDISGNGNNATPEGSNPTFNSSDVGGYSSMNITVDNGLVVTTGFAATDVFSFHAIMTHNSSLAASETFLMGSNWGSNIWLKLHTDARFRRQGSVRSASYTAVASDTFIVSAVFGTASENSFVYVDNVEIISAATMNNFAVGDIIIGGRGSGGNGFTGKIHECLIIDGTTSVGDIETLYNFWNDKFLT